MNTSFKSANDAWKTNWHLNRYWAWTSAWAQWVASNSDFWSSISQNLYLKSHFHSDFSNQGIRQHANSKISRIVAFEYYLSQLSYLQGESLTCSYISIADSWFQKNHIFFLSFFKFVPIKKIQAVESSWKMLFFSIDGKRFHQMRWFQEWSFSFFWQFYLNTKFDKHSSVPQL